MSSEPSSNISKVAPLSGFETSLKRMRHRAPPSRVTVGVAGFAAVAFGSLFDSVVTK